MPEQIIKTADGQVCSTIAEVNATLLYDVGFNAKQQMLQDRYLMTFVPTLTDEILKKNGIKSIGMVQDAIEKNTALLETLVQDAIEANKNAWLDEIEFARGVQRKAENLAYILDKRAEYMRRPALKTPLAIDDLRSKLDSAEKDLRNKKSLYETMKDSESPMKKQLEAAITAAENNKQRLEGELTAFNEPLQRMTGEGVDEQMTAAYAPYIYFITKMVEEGRKEYEGKAAEYMEKYGCVPSFLKTFLDLLKFAESSVYESDIDSLEVRKMLTMGIRQYIDILEDGPKLIYATAKLYPEYQKSYDEETDIYYRTEEELVSGQASAMGRMKALQDQQGEMEVKDEIGFDAQDYFKSKYRLNGILFSNILAHQFKTLEKVQDRRVPAIFGPPGIGKTAGVEATIKRIDSVVNDFFGRTFSVPHMDSSQFSGPMAVNENDEAMQFMPSGMKPLVNKPGLCLFDEATAANDPAVHNQLATVTQKGTLTEGIKMHPLMLMVFAGNDDPNDNANVEALSHVEKTRLQIMYMLDPKSIMVGWENYITHDPETMGNKYRAAAASFIISFLNTKEGREYRLTKSTERGRGISPNLRTWTNFIKDLEPLFAMDSFNNKKMREMGRSQIIASGSRIVGAKAASELADYYIKYVNLTSIDELLKMSKKFSMLDAIRVYDSTNRSGELAGGNTSIYAAVDNETGKERYVIDSPQECDQDLVDAKNRLYLKGLKEKGKSVDPAQFNEKNPAFATVKKELMSKKDFEEQYNKLWPCEDMGSAAAIAYYKNGMKSYYEALFEDARRTRKPIDGEKLDDIMKLAMLIPQKAFRQEVTIDMINGFLHPQRTEVLKKYGVSYKKGNSTIVKRFNPDPESKLKEGEQRSPRLNTMSYYALAFSHALHDTLVEQREQREAAMPNKRGVQKEQELDMPGR